DDDDAPDAVTARPAADGAGLARRRLRTPAQRDDCTRRHAESHQSGSGERIALREVDPRPLERRVTRRKRFARHDDAWGDAGTVERGGFERTIANRPGEHYDGVRRARQ